eukprot:2509099-Amphidinium_carterae.1
MPNLMREIGGLAICNLHVLIKKTKYKHDSHDQKSTYILTMEAITRTIMLTGMTMMTSSKIKERTNHGERLRGLCSCNIGGMRAHRSQSLLRERTCEAIDTAHEPTQTRQGRDAGTRQA